MAVYSWGANSHGQLGLGMENELCMQPQPLTRPSVNVSAIRAMCGGGGHVLVLEQTGLVHSCGWNNRGQLGLDDGADNHNKFTPIPCEYFNDAAVESIACGWDISGAITSNGGLFVWGSNSFQQLGVCQRGFTSVRRPFPLRLPRTEIPRQISFGLRHCCILTDDDRIYVLGRLRFSDPHPALKITQGRFNKMEDVVRVQCEYKIDAIASGQNHMIILADSRRRIFALGDNKFGQANCYQFDEEVKQIACGWTHNGVLTKGNKVYLWGRNCYGQLGTDACDAIKTPTELRLPGTELPKRLHLGSEHGLVLTANGQVYTWGWNEHGNCGTGNCENVYTPTVVKLPSHCRLTGTGAGFCFAICDPERSVE